MFRAIFRALSHGAFVLFALNSASIAATSQSGVVVAVIQSAEVDGQTGRKVLRPAAPVFSGDRIITGNIGEAQLRFRDDTKLVVGPNSAMVIDAFVFNEDATARKVSIAATRGAFRFITGKSRKDAYSITTPTATIGIRGTAFDFSVDQGGGTRVAVFHGSTKVCDRQQRSCVIQTAGCNIAAVDPGKKPRRVLAQFDRLQELTRNFRYIRSQVSLKQEFRVNVAACQIERAEVPGSVPGVIPLVKTVAGDPPPPPPPPPPPDPTPTGSTNHSGLSDGSNPGEGSSHSKSQNQGSQNPGGGG